MIEEWKLYKDTRSVPNGALWEVSNLGRVKKNNELFIPNIHRSGYVYIADYQLHRIIAKLFIPNPDNKPQVDHINGVKTDNRVENLRWVTNKENMNNPITKATKRTTKGYKYSDEINKKKGHKGQDNPMYGKSWNKGLSKENNDSLARMSKRMSGSGNPMYNKHRKRIYNDDGTYKYIKVA